MPPPRSVFCESCGKQCLKHSYPLHLSRCRVKKAQSFTSCPKCLLPVSNDEYSQHLRQCSVRKPKRKNEKPVNKFASTLSLETTTQGCRVPCCVCGRTFFKERIARHQRICLANKRRPPRRPFPTASEMRLRNTEFLNCCKLSTKKIALECKRSWRHEHGGLKHVIEQGRLIKEFHRRGIELSKLPPIGESISQAVDKSNADPSVSEAIHAVYSSIPRTQKSVYYGTKQAMFFRIGEKVLVETRFCTGYIRFIGRLDNFFPGYWMGVELINQNGCNSGELQGNKYFDCAEMSGVFVRPSKITKLHVFFRRLNAEGSAEQEVDNLAGVTIKKNSADKLRAKVNLISPRYQVPGFATDENSQDCSNKPRSQFRKSNSGLASVRAKYFDKRLRLKK